MAEGTLQIEVTPRHPAQLMGPLFSQAVLAVLFALTFEKALEVRFETLRHYQTIHALLSSFTNDLEGHTFGLMQLAAFLATLFRFYAGSYRFHQEPPEQIGTAGIVVDLAGTAILFIGFYVAALLVNTFEIFLLFVGLFHAVDVGWFIVGRFVTKYRPHVQAVTRNFIVYDSITIALFGIIDLWFRRSAFPPQWFQAATALILFAMFGVDMLWHSRDWYFEPGKWEAAHSGGR